MQGDPFLSLYLSYGLREVFYLNMNSSYSYVCDKWVDSFLSYFEVNVNELNTSQACASSQCKQWILIKVNAIQWNGTIC